LLWHGNLAQYHLQASEEVLSQLDSINAQPYGGNGSSQDNHFSFTQVKGSDDYCSQWSTVGHSGFGTQIIYQSDKPH
jgi:hypothetical protein